VDEYHEMIRAGILKSGDPVELLEGWLILKMSKNPPHRLATYLARKAIEAAVPSGWYVDSQEPITTADSEPEPDITVVRGDPRQYGDRHPGPQDLALAVEVSDASLPRDSTLKKRIYARAGVPVYWIINLIDRKVEVFTNPTGPADEPDYRDHRGFAPADRVPVVLDGREVGSIVVSELLP
jgi:Uma2 family endonuclease